MSDEQRVDLPGKQAVALTSMLINLEAMSNEVQRATKMRDAEKEKLEGYIAEVAASLAPKDMEYRGLDLAEGQMLFAAKAVEPSVSDPSEEEAAVT